MTSALLNIKKASFKGFTLIELLIVIAILGILAAVVLVAINPAEQLARARDAGRQSGISQLGHALQSYYTTQQSLPTSTGSATWDFQATLISTQDIQNNITAPTSGVTACSPTASTTVSISHGYCYSESAGTSFVVWTPLESQNSTNLAKCTSGNTYVVEVYSSTQGAAGIDCITSSTSVPGTGDVLH